MKKLSILLKTITYSIVTIIIIYIVIYLIYTFTVWKFDNPFGWILEMGKFTQMSRFAILTSISGAIILIGILYSPNEFKKK